MDEGTRQFPDFCRPGNLLSVFLIAELIVLVLALSPRRLPAFDWGDLALLSLFAQVLALWCAATLCGLRSWFRRRSTAVSLAAAYVLVIVVTAAGTLAGHWLDGMLQLRPATARLPLSDALLGNVAVTALIAAAALRYFQVQMEWRSQVEAAASARLQALQARIRPHFLFNALNSIASVARRDPAVAERAVEDLADLFRATLDKGGSLWEVGDELATCRRYVALEALRLGDRLTVTWDVDELPVGARIPALLLQPLVENAIQHGIQLLRDGGTVHVTGRLVADDPSLGQVVVTNPVPRDGRGQRGGAGQALANIRQRLMLRYGARGTLATERGPDGFTATLTWPLRQDNVHGDGE